MQEGCQVRAVGLPSRHDLIIAPDFNNIQLIAALVSGTLALRTGLGIAEVDTLCL
jgi:hypothetical protein